MSVARHASARFGSVLVHTRGFASGALNATDLIELREYKIQPGSFSQFLSLAERVKGVRQELLPTVATLRCDLSNSMDLNSFVHLYRWRSHDHRDEVRRASAADARWTAYLREAKPMFMAQKSSIYKPAATIMGALGADPDPSKAAARRSRLPMVEFRRYRLKAGYTTVPKALEAFELALPAKMAAARAAGVEHELELLAYTDVGRLNELIEVWRFGRASDSIRAREASRGVGVWRDAIATLTELTDQFDTSFLYEA